MFVIIKDAEKEKRCRADDKYKPYQLLDELYRISSRRPVVHAEAGLGRALPQRPVEPGDAPVAAHQQGEGQIRIRCRIGGTQFSTAVFPDCCGDPDQLGTVFRRPGDIGRRFPLPQPPVRVFCRIQKCGHGSDICQNTGDHMTEADIIIISSSPAAL